jgi:hypothetical protein
VAWAAGAMLLCRAASESMGGFVGSTCHSKEGTTMRRSRLVFYAAVTGASLATAPAVAVADPNTFASAQKGSLLVSSSVLVANRNAEMMGGWNNENVACNVSRRLTVRILIDRVRGGTTDRARRKKSGRVTNCAEGGPNFGFIIRAADVGLACPDGSWMPGRYDFVTNTLHHRSGLRAIGTLFFRISDPC